MALATVGRQGTPHLAPVYFVAMRNSHHQSSSGWHLYFFSASDSQHAEDLNTCRQVAASIYPDCYGWEDIRGLQIRGIVYPVKSEVEWEQAWLAYREKFPFVTKLKAIVVQNSLYALAPSWVRLIDNRIDFGYKQEWVLGNSERLSTEEPR